jgi:hypothetical protein
MPLLDVTTQEINEMKTMVTTEVDGFITEIHEIADFDFNALSSTQLERIGVIAEMIQMIFDGINDGNNGSDDPEVLQFGISTITVLSTSYFSFTPTVSNWYTITSYVPNYLPDPYIYVYDNNMGFLGHDDDSGDTYYNFEVTLYMNAGHEYIFEISTYESGNYSFNISIYN